MRYCATFHTHLAAILTAKRLNAADAAARLAPVPRCLSSSCGTCVFFEADSPMYDRLDRDTQAVYQAAEDGYRLISIISE